MGVKIERAAGWSYFGWSAVLLLTWLFLTFAPIWHRSELSDIQYERVPLQWTEYVQIFTGSLLVAAIYGCFTLLFLLNRNRMGRMSIAFAGCAVLLGFLSWFLAVVSLTLAHADCANDCVSYIPDLAASATIEALLLPFALIPPAVFLIAVIVGRILQRRRITANT
ncbi:hypothetical protein [Diaminobutyricibacter sp. McL0608]|uniref:hypothetical protein n=1 Tax=Leifsonia sp. McL0608 TaxID=3143537 RepID=UPI0031F33664